jgi:hypothetical protein
MDTVLNIPIEGYQSVGTIPLFWLRKNLNTGVEPGGELRRIFSSWLANGSAAERKKASSLVVNPTLRRRLSLPAGTATQNSGRLHPFETPTSKSRVPQATPDLGAARSGFHQRFFVSRR